MNRVLVIRLGAIGDVIMATPLLDAIWNLHPSCQVDWLVGEVSAPILQSIADPRLRIIIANERDIFRGTAAKRCAAILRSWARLGFARYDRILILNSDRRYGILPLLCRGPRQWFRPGISRTVVPGRHHSVEYVRMATGVDDSCAPWPTYPSIATHSLPGEIAESIKGSSPIIALAPAGAKNIMREEGLRRWHLDGYRRVAGLLRQEGYRVVLVGGPTDIWVSQAMADQCDLDLVGKLDLSRFLSILSQVDLLVTHDSGPLHMADFVGTPVVGIFGPTLAEEKRPIAVAHRIVVESQDRACRPCYDGRLYASCSDVRCMQSISPEQVMTAIRDLLGNRS